MDNHHDLSLSLELSSPLHSYGIILSYLQVHSHHITRPRVQTAGTWGMLFQDEDWIPLNPYSEMPHVQCWGLPRQPVTCNGWAATATFHQRQKTWWNGKKVTSMCICYQNKKLLLQQTVHRPTQKMQNNTKTPVFFSMCRSFLVGLLRGSSFWVCNTHKPSK